jgi:regulator of protease activity HflC (stomatin/prohibitin superfamily)
MTWARAAMLVVILLFIAASFRILREYQRGVVFQLGRFWKVKGPGLVIVIPGIQQMVRVDLRTIVLDVPTQDVISRDNVSVKVNAVIYFRVLEPTKAVLQVENYLYAASQIAQTTLRSTLGESELDDLLAKREKINQELQMVIDRHTEPWGIKVSTVEVKNVDLPQEMQRAIARQAEAERERRAKVINAEGELQASQKLSEAAAVIAREPLAMQLRYLQTLAEIATENNSTTLFPIPIDLFEPLIRAREHARSVCSGGGERS